MKPVIVLGSGCHAKVLLGMLQRLDINIIGLVDPQRIKGSSFLNIPVLGNDDYVNNHHVDDIELVNGVGSLPHDAGIRMALFQKFQQQGYRFASLCDPCAFLGQNVELAQGVQVMAGAIIQSGTTIAENAIVNSGAIIEHDSCIGQHVHIAPGAIVCGQVTLGNRVHIGAGATVIQGISIGDGSIVGAGCVVTQAIGQQQIVYPARSYIRQL